MNPLKKRYLEHLDRLKLLIFSFKWQRYNKHNFTYPNCLYPISMVNVGKQTYGPINLKYYGREDAKLSIGAYCSISANSMFLLSGEHRYDTILTYPIDTMLFKEYVPADTKGNIVVKDDVWIGHGAIILSGVTIGQGAIIGTGAVVTKDIPPYAIVGGVPAKIIKYRFNEEIVRELTKLDISKLTIDDLRKNRAFFEKECSKESIEVLMRLFQEKKNEKS